MKGGIKGAETGGYIGLVVELVEHKAPHRTHPIRSIGVSVEERPVGKSDTIQQEDHVEKKTDEPTERRWMEAVIAGEHESEIERMFK